MEIILQTKVPNLGNIGDRVRVRDGYARNYLLPQGFAITATEKNIAVFEAKRAELEAKAAQKLKEAQERSEKIKQLKIVIESLASDEGKLYGSVGTTEIAHAINSQGVKVEKREICLPTGVLRSIGEYAIDLQLHSDVTASIMITVIPAKK